MIENTLLWAISLIGETQLKTLAALLDRERAATQAKAYGEFTAGPALDAVQAGLPITIRDNVAIIPVSGIMLKSYPWPSNYVSSTAHVRAAVRAARLDASIDHIVIVSDTPGGDVRGMHELTDEVAAAAQEKNVIVQIQGILASAGYHFAAQANSIYASHRMNRVGSIGVRTVLWDSTEMYEKAGIKVIKIDTGEHKSTGLEGVPVTEEQQAEVQRTVDLLYAEFLRVIEVGRGISKEALKPLADGREWFAEDALKHNLIDAIQPLDTTLSALSKPHKSRLSHTAVAEMFSEFTA